jgi:predicted membrane channel-forming protein YqfA (hemolysin III family)
MHFLIALDATLHVTIIALAILATVYFCMFVKAHPNSTKTTVAIAYGMYPLMVFLLAQTFYSAFECFRQYHQWWTR